MSVVGNVNNMETVYIVCIAIFFTFWHRGTFFNSESTRRQLLELLCRTANPQMLSSDFIFNIINHLSLVYSIHVKWGYNKDYSNSNSNRWASRIEEIRVVVSDIYGKWRASHPWTPLAISHHEWYFINIPFMLFRQPGSKVFYRGQVLFDFAPPCFLTRFNLERGLAGRRYKTMAESTASVQTLQIQTRDRLHQAL